MGSGAGIDSMFPPISIRGTPEAVALHHQLMMAL
jgi:hypothetical protein